MIYVISSKDAYAAKRLNNEARIMNYGLKVVDLRWLIDHNFKIPLKVGDVLYVRNPYLKGSAAYLPKVIELAKRFEAKGGRVVDANIARGDLGRGKWADYQKLKRAGLPVPKTVNYESRIINYGFKLSPKHFALSPLVLKWIYGLKSRGTFLINSQISKSEFQNIIKLHPQKEWMLQEYIEADYEYKIITIGYQALPVILRFKFNKKLGGVDFRSSKTLFCHLGIRSGIQDLNVHSIWKNHINLDSRSEFTPCLIRRGNDNVEKMIQLAQRAARTLGRELAKVDILKKNGKFYILEVNRFPGLRTFESLTKFNVFRRFLDYLQNN